MNSNFIKSVVSIFSIVHTLSIIILNGNKKYEIKFSKVFYKSYCKIKGEFNRVILNGFVDRLILFVDGENNTISSSNAYFFNTTITVSGNNNQIILEDGVKFTNSNIIIRGEDCKLFIGKDTTFGGIRIVNAGLNNEIIIGSNCLFSDKIELWASDTHPVYDEKNFVVNKEKPIKIGDNVWVGARVIILKGVSINSNSIIGMGTVVVHDVPHSCASVGNPNRIVKRNVHWSNQLI